MPRAFTGWFEWFVRSEVAGSDLLLACTVAALVWANSPWDQSYFDLLHTEINIDADIVHLDLTLQHWVNDGLMTIFFFLLGLEI